MKFLICSTDEENFDHVVLLFPLVGTHERFVVPIDQFNDHEDELADLGIELLAVV